MFSLLGIEVKVPVLSVLVSVWTLLSVSEALIKPNGKAIVITGCDSSFGYQSALKLNEIGFKIYAIVESSTIAGALDLVKKVSTPHKLIVFQMDVTNDNQMKEVLNKVKHDLTSSGYELWALINGLSIDSFGPIELGTVDRYKRIFEVNVYGTARVTRAFLPLIKLSKGRIINVLSVLSRLSARFVGPSSMTKHAVLAFSDILRQEVSRFGVKVVIIEPGVIRAHLSSTQLEKDWNQSSDDVKRIYHSYENVKEITESLLGFLPADENNDRVLKDIIESIVSLKPKANYKRNFNFQILFAFFIRVLPTKVTDLLCTSIQKFYYNVLRNSAQELFLSSSQSIIPQNISNRIIADTVKQQNIAQTVVSSPNIPQTSSLQTISPPITISQTTSTLIEYSLSPQNVLPQTTNPPVVGPPNVAQSTSPPVVNSQAIAPQTESHSMIGSSDSSHPTHIHARSGSPGVKSRNMTHRTVSHHQSITPHHFDPKTIDTSKSMKSKKFHFEPPSRIKPGRVGKFSKGIKSDFKQFND